MRRPCAARDRPFASVGTSTRPVITLPGRYMTVSLSACRPGDGTALPVSRTIGKSRRAGSGASPRRPAAHRPCVLPAFRANRPAMPPVRRASQEAGRPGRRCRDRHVVIAQRPEVDGLACGRGDRRPDDLVFGIEMRAYLRQQRSGIAADGGRSARRAGRRLRDGDLGENRAEPPQVVADGPVRHNHGGEVGLRLADGPGGPRGTWHSSGCTWRPPLSSGSCMTCSPRASASPSATSPPGPLWRPCSPPERNRGGTGHSAHNSAPAQRP